MRFAPRALSACLITSTVGAPVQAGIQDGYFDPYPFVCALSTIPLLMVVGIVVSFYALKPKRELPPRSTQQTNLENARDHS